MPIGNVSQEIGSPIPSNTPHPVSVTLPTWESNIGYEKGESWVVDKMMSGYPRFFIHPIIKRLARKLEEKYSMSGESCMIFPSYNAAKRCREFIRSHSEMKNIRVRVLQLSTSGPSSELDKSSVIESSFGIAFFPESEFYIAKQYWQHSGEGISSRMGAYLLREILEKNQNNYHHFRNKQELQAQQIQKRSPSLSKLLKRTSFGDNEETDREFNSFIEQKYGRILDLKFADKAAIALRRRISGKVDRSENQAEEMDKARRGKNISETDVYLYPTGMASIFHIHRALRMISSVPKKSICFGFPYVDTRNILQKFGEGYYFYGHGDENSLDEIEKKLDLGEISIMALYCEFPSNPLLKSPNLKRIKNLGDKFGFAVIVDDTIGNFLNVDVLKHSDVVVSSLTKLFSGDANVTGGSLILNPASSYYTQLKDFFSEDYENLTWPEDILYLERNSRDFAERCTRIDENALQVVELFKNSSLIDSVFYPNISEGKEFYEEIKTAKGGYGGLLSIVFKDPKKAIVFYDNLQLYKGPSLGTNFTLISPYSILAHFNELDKIKEWGVDPNLIRLSIGLEDRRELCHELQRCLDIAKNS